MNMMFRLVAVVVVVVAFFCVLADSCAATTQKRPSPPSANHCLVGTEKGEPFNGFRETFLGESNSTSA